MRNIDPERLTLLTKARPMKVADGTAGIVFREIVAVKLDGKMGGHDKRAKGWGLSQDELLQESIPFTSKSKANRLLDVLDAVHDKGRLYSPGGVALWLSNSSYHPDSAPHLVTQAPVRANNLQEGRLYIPHDDDGSKPLLPIVGTKNPAEALCILRDSVSLAKAGDVLHAYGAVALMQVRADDSMPIMSNPREFEY